MKNVFATVDDEGTVSVLFKDDSVNLIIVNTDHLEDYMFLYKGNEVVIDSVDEDGTATLYLEEEDRFLHDVPVEELDVIDGEEYLDV